MRRVDLDNLRKDLEGIVKTLDLINLEERMENKMEENGERMGHMEPNIERIVKLL